MQVSRSLSLRLLVFGIALVIHTAGHAQVGEPVPAPNELAAAFNLDRAMVQHLVLPAQVGSAFQVQLQLDGEKHVLALYPHDIRSPDYKLLIDGSPVAATEFRKSPDLPYKAHGLDRGEDFFRVAHELFKFVGREEPFAGLEYRLER